MPAMTSTGARARRGHFARLVVVAVLTGLAVIVGMQCADGMALAMPMSHTTTMTTLVTEHEPDPNTGTGTGESLTTCLVLFVAVAAAAFVLTLPAVRTVSVVGQALCAVVAAVSAQCRAPSLATLCLLRI
jgi:hypothetical protein